MLRLFKRNKKHKLSKREYWRKWEYFEIIDDLHQAKKLLSSMNSGKSTNFRSLKEFHETLIDAIDDLEFGNNNDLTVFYRWFTPNSDWHEFTGQIGEELRISVFERVSNWKNANC